MDSLGLSGHHAGGFHCQPELARNQIPGEPRAHTEVENFFYALWKMDLIQIQPCIHQLFGPAYRPSAVLL